MKQRGGAAEHHGGTGRHEFDGPLKCQQLIRFKCKKEEGVGRGEGRNWVVLTKLKLMTDSAVRFYL